MATVNEKKLFLTLKNEAGKTVSLNFDQPKTDLTRAQVDEAINFIIAQNLFQTTGGNLVTLDSVKIVDQTTTELL